MLGEADNLLLFRNADFVPVEVKRSFSGVVEGEVNKLSELASALRAPWSAVAVCEYGRGAPDAFIGLECRSEGADPFRLILTYDTLLEQHPIWALGTDPFAWAPLSDEAIRKRETAFVQRLARGVEEEDASWLEHSMLRRPGKSKTGEKDSD